jgi:hypothetical protein
MSIGEMNDTIQDYAVELDRATMSEAVQSKNDGEAA